MARPQNPGLSYFPFDTTFFQDIRIKKMIRYKGGSSVSIYCYLLCLIYREGCYLIWDDEFNFVVANDLGFDEQQVKDVVSYCLEIDLFSKIRFETNKCLTSHGIQERYVMAAKKLNKIVSIPTEVTLLSSEEMPVSSEEIGVKSEEMPVSSKETGVKSSVIPLKKLKEIKIKETKGKKTFVFSPPSISDVSAYVIGLYEISDQGAQKFAEKFVRYYESVEWMVGKGTKKFKMKDWHRSVTVQWRDTVDEIATEYPKIVEKVKFDPNNPVETFAAYKKPQFVH